MYVKAKFYKQINSFNWVSGCSSDRTPNLSYCLIGRFKIKRLNVRKMSVGTRGLQYDWQNECKSRGERAKYILENGLFTDCEFLVGSDEGKEVSN